MRKLLLATPGFPRSHGNDYQDSDSELILDLLQLRGPPFRIALTASLPPTSAAQSRNFHT